MTTNRHRRHGPRRDVRYLAAALAVAAQVFARGAAGADPVEAHPPDRVLIVADEPGDPLLNRVIAEISAVPGVTIVIRPPVGSLDTDARAEHAKAAIRKLASGMGVEVWMADATTGRSLLRQIIVDESREGPDQSLVALQAAELLRTSLFAHEAPAHGPAPASSPPTAIAVVAPPPSPAGENTLLASVGALYSSGGVSPAVQAWLSYQRLWSHNLGVTFDVSAPLSRGTIKGPEGSADVGALVAAGGLLARLKSDHAHATVAASLGGGFASILVKGRPIQSLEGTSTSAYTGLVYLRVYGGWNPARHVGLGAAAMIGTTTSRVRIQFANRNVGEWGTPVAGAFFYAELRWN